MLPLSFAKVGDAPYIRGITGKDDVRAHLAEMGFVVGEQVRIISDMGGNLIIGVKDSRVAISKALAARIMI